MMRCTNLHLPHQRVWPVAATALFAAFLSCSAPSGQEDKGPPVFRIGKDTLQDKIRGGWAGYVAGAAYGAQTAQTYTKGIIPDNVEIEWNDDKTAAFMAPEPGFSDGLYVSFALMEAFEKEGLGAGSAVLGKAFAQGGFPVFHANKQARHNILNGLLPPISGQWMHNPFSDDMGFQGASGFIGLMNPGMPNSTLAFTEKLCHISNEGDGYYASVFPALLHCLAFTHDSPADIIVRSLAAFPPESHFHQCISNVLGWHEQYPDNWKQAWLLAGKKWGSGNSMGSQGGNGINSDAKLNMAYVAIALLYGEGDFGRSVEIATRCGQASATNPAIVGGVLGTLMGFGNIPDSWTYGLTNAADVPFPFTNFSFDQACALSHKHALSNIRDNRGRFENEAVFIRYVEPVKLPFEVSFPGLEAQVAPLEARLSAKSRLEFETAFTGKGYALLGRAGLADSPDKGGQPPAALEVDVYLDGNLVRTVKMPFGDLQHSPLVCFGFQLEDGPHQLNLQVKEDSLPSGAFLEISGIVVYTPSETAQ